MKLDMSKAYDRVEWDFLKSVMIKLGFKHDLVSLIMRCVHTVSYSVLVNGIPSDSFTPERGFRQGDPLSPHRFLFCAEALTALIKQAERNGNIHGVRITRNAPVVSHLFFADDTILFIRANEKEANAVKQILQNYETASGQRMLLQYFSG